MPAVGSYDAAGPGLVSVRVETKKIKDVHFQISWLVFELISICKIKKENNKNVKKSHAFAIFFEKFFVLRTRF